MIGWEESGAGAPAVFVHGITEDRHVWDRVIPLLEPHLRCVRLDLRGHGESSMTDDLSAFAMADDIATVLDDAGIDEPPLLVGHSLGGVVVTAYAAQAPTRAVVNVDQPLRFSDFARALQPMADSLRGPDWRAAVEIVFASLGIGELDDEARRYVIAELDETPQEVILGVWGLVLDTPPEELDALVEPMLSAITVPYLSIHGADPGDDYERWLRQRLPTVTSEVWEGRGHFIQFTAPERLANRIREFVTS